MFDIAKRVGKPLRIDKKTLDKEIVLYARVLVDIEFTKDLLGKT